MQHQISTVKSIEDGAESYLRTLNSSIPNFTLSPEENTQSLIIIRKMMTEFHNPRIERELQELNENYDKCLLKLATVDPISAYRLKGKNKIVSYLNQWNNFASENIIFNQMVISDPKTIQISESIMPQVETELIKETLHDIQEIIKTMAKRIGGKTSRDFRKQIMQPQSETKIEVDERMKKFVDEIMIPTIKKMQEQSK
ncbi:MAG: hypothetical protein IPO63_00695 [Bacteroidetes bacterium]|nr:hypothetical protein [Bacteroidota bacterium]